MKMLNKHKNETMKTLISTILTPLFLFTLSTTGIAQEVKLGHVNKQEILENLPGRDKAEKKVQQFAQQRQRDIKEMNTEYQNKLQEYQQNQEGMTETEKQSTMDRLNNLQQRIQKAQRKAQQDLRKQEQELMQPLIDKVDSAIQKVADREGYTYVFDVSSGNVAYADDSKDLTGTVKKELDISSGANSGNKGQ